MIARILNRLTPDLWADHWQTEADTLGAMRGSRKRLDALNARAPEPHRYAPDWQAQGDCRLCGLGAEDHGTNQGGLRK